MPTGEAVTIALFDLCIARSDQADVVATVRLCLPDPVIQHLIEGGAAPTTLDPVSSAGGSTLRKPTRDMLTAAAELRAMLAETKLRLSDLLAMQVGDVIVTDRPADAAVSMETESGVRVGGQLGQWRGMRAVRVTSDCSASAGESP